MGKSSKEKAAMKEEAERLGISYDELKKKEKKRKKREAESLESEEHLTEIKRMRTWSKDYDGDKSKTSTTTTSTTTTSQPKESGDDDGQANKRRRTRSMDIAEEQDAKIEEEKKLSPTEWRKLHSLNLQGHGVYRGTQDFVAPYIEFSDAPFAKRIQDTLTGAGFKQPTAIQAQAWPLAIEGKDLISIAKTGSGKTCGFLLPVFHKYQLDNPNPFANRPPGGRSYGGRGGRGGPAGRGRPPMGGGGGPPSKPLLLVLAPTRELSVQILEEAQKFGRPIGVRCVCCYGGSSKYPQIAALERGVECIIATPGRLNDLIEMKKVDLSGIQFLVLDEADRMLDMGFEPQIRSIVDKVPRERQTMLFSATWPKEIQRLAHDFLKDPVQINVGEVDTLVANKDIKQTIVMCRENEKMDKLTEILNDLTNKGKEDEEDKSKNGNGRSQQAAGGGKQHAKLIVFVAKKVSCHELANRLWDDGFAVDALHGDRPQWERTRVMQAFKQGTLRMLIATDVAARGLDVKDVGVVVNYDMPAGVNAVEDYVHRIGRTGRAGAKGIAYTFFTDGDKKCATQLVETLRKAGQDIPAELQAMVRPRFGRGGRGGRGGGGYRQYGRGGGGGRGYMGGGGGGRGGGFGFGGRGRGGGRGYGGGGRYGRR